MYIRVLEITDLRVIERIRIEPAAGLNFIVGENGSGKTSLLEGIYLASRGRTFRHAEAGPMIRFGAEQTTVVAHLAPDRVDGSADESGAILGVRRGKQSLLCRLNGSDVRKRSELAEALPVQWIGSQPQLLISMGPEVRRRFVDMGLFHVEPPYLRAYAEFQRTLQQRNAAIRQGSREQVSFWSTPFAAASEALNEYRESFSERLVRRTLELLGEWHTDFTIDYRFRRGWSSTVHLEEELRRKVDLDLKMGFTTIGPQRAELEISVEGGVAEKRLSRGQQKVLVFALNLAMQDLIKSRKGTAPILLVDDLNAELDQLNREKLLAAIVARGGQTFIAAIELPIDVGRLPPGTRLFHVEHGRCTSDD